MSRRALKRLSKLFAKPVAAEAPEALPYSTQELYTPLPETSPTIRLLHLHAGCWEDDIEASLDQHSLEKARNCYIAISYNWGQEGIDRPVLIRCNGKSVFVSSNLFTVLRRLRQPDRLVQVWADALCINQADSAERTQQVGLMADIYSRGRETVIWLGEPGPNDDMGDRFVYADHQPRLNLSLRTATPRIAWTGNAGDEVLRDVYLEQPGSYSDIEGNIPPDIFGAFCLIHEMAENIPYTELKTLVRPRSQEQYVANFGWQKTPAVWAGLARLMNRPWWTRIWVVQETVLSQKATVHYGILSAPWSMFARAAANHVRQSQEQCLDLSGSFEGHSTLNHFSTLVLRIDDTRRHHENFHAGDTTLSSLLWKFKPLDASDKRDKVFALLGLTTTWQGGIPMLPDYSNTLAQTYLKTTVGNIQRARSLTALAGDLEDVLNRRRQEGLASWVMDWSLPCLATEIERVGSLHMYDAGGSGNGTVRIHDAHSILEVEAIHIDTVEVTGEVSRHTQISDTCAVIRQCNLLTHSYEDMLGRYPTGCTYDQAFWRTLVGDLIHIGTNMDPQANKTVFRPATAYDFDAFRAWRMWSRCISRDTLGRSAAFTQRDLDEGISSVHYALKTATSSRRFFLTAGGYMGIAPKTTVPGDRLYVFKTSNVPFIVRPSRSVSCEDGRRTMLLSDELGYVADETCNDSHDCVQLVGDAFAYGLMDGEALEMHHARTEKLFIA